MNEDAILAVKRGIYWLDENHPGWASHIDLDYLDMAECRDCVIGQAVGNYSEIIRSQDVSNDITSGVIWAVEHGFESPSVYHYQAYADAPISAIYGYHTLDTLWANEVKERLGG